MNLSGEYFYSIAALFSCSAYLLGNILWLRILLILASTTYIISGVSLGITSMVGWNSAYLIINAYHVMLLLMDRITITLPQEAKNIYHLHFSHMSTREFKKIITINNFCTISNKTIIHETDTTDKLYIVLKGTVNIVSNGVPIACLCEGDMIGEMSFMRNKPASVSSSANAIAEGVVECAFWTHEDLDKLKLKNREVYNKFISVIGCDLVRKLKRKNELNGLQTARLDNLL